MQEVYKFLTFNLVPVNGSCERINFPILINSHIMYHYIHQIKN